MDWKQGLKIVEVTFSHADSLIWEQAKEDAKDHRDRSPSALQKSRQGVKNNAMDSIFDYFMRPNSPSVQTILRMASMARVEHLKFMLARTTQQKYTRIFNMRIAQQWS